MARDAAGTLAVLDAARAAFAARVSEQHGRIVDTAGDSVLAVFETAAGAVQAAVDIQADLATQARDAPRDMTLPFRIGIHLGDVIQKADGSVYGNGVNVAARVQTLATPGGIAISDTLRSTLGETSPHLVFEDLGVHKAKNIAQPLQVYSISTTEWSASDYAWQPEVARNDALAVAPDNLPLPWTSFIGRANALPHCSTPIIGRDADQAAVTTLLENNSLITVTGPGGIGKTRLAVAIAHQCSGQSSHRVGWVDLAALSDPLLVPITIATALGIQIDETLSTVESLAVAMRRLAILVILDNAEHLVDAVATVASAVRSSASNVRLLVTSREPLRVSGEVVYRLEGLSTPNGKLPLNEAELHGAIALFVARVKASDRRFQLTERHCAKAIDICRHLDGIPLAIELAAARVASLGLAAVCTRLTEGFRLLVAGSRAAPARQQTMLATFDWSYRLLSETERSVFSRLGVFSGGFTLEACRAVTSDNKIDEWMAVEALSSLVDKSMIVTDAKEPPRYFMLETARSYALQKLVESDELARAQRKHAAYFADLFEASYGKFVVESEAVWSVNIMHELENLRAALSWALASQEDLSIGIRLVAASLPMWIGLHRQHVSEGRKYFELAGQRSSNQTPADIDGRLHFGYGVLLGLVDAERSRQLLERAIQLFRECRNDRGLAHALVEYARLLARTGECDLAERALENAFQLLSSLHAPTLLGLHRLALGFVQLIRGERETAGDHYKSAVRLFEAAGAESLMQQATNDLGDNAWASGDLDEAATRFRQAIEWVHGSRFTNSDLIAVPMINLAGVLTERGNVAEALALANVAVPILLDGGRAMFAYDTLALCLAKSGRYADAARIRGRSIAAYATAKLTEHEPNEKRMRDSLKSLLGEQLTVQDLHSLFAEGADLTDENACRLALQS